MTSAIMDLRLTLRQALTKVLQEATERQSGSTIISAVRKFGFKSGDIRRELRAMVDEGIVNIVGGSSYLWAKAAGVVEHPMAEDGSGPTTGELSWGEHSYEIGMQAINADRPLTVDTQEKSVFGGKIFPCPACGGRGAHEAGCPLQRQAMSEPFLVSDEMQALSLADPLRPCARCPHPLGCTKTGITDCGKKITRSADCQKEERPHVMGPDACWCTKHHYECNLCHADCTSGTERGPATFDGIKIRCRICQGQWESYRAASSPQTEEDMILLQNALTYYSTSRGVDDGVREQAKEFLRRRSEKISRTELGRYLPDQG